MKTATRHCHLADTFQTKCFSGHGRSAVCPRPGLEFLCCLGTTRCHPSGRREAGGDSDLTRSETLPNDYDQGKGAVRSRGWLWNGHGCKGSAGAGERAETPAGSRLSPEGGTGVRADAPGERGEGTLLRPAHRGGRLGGDSSAGTALGRASEPVWTEDVVGGQPSKGLSF